MKIALGYILTFGWVFLVLGLTLLLKRKTGADDELTRKIVHVGVAFAWVPMYFCFGTSWHLIVPPAVFIVLNTVSYQKNLFRAMERSDASKKSLGTVYYAVSMTVMAVWCVLMPECLVPYGMGLFCMALGDGLAPIFGSFRKGNLRLPGGRSLYGSLGVFVVCLGVAAAMSGLFGLQFPFWKCLTIAAAATVLEFVGFRGLDNLTLPLGVFLLTFYFML